MGNKIFYLQQRIGYTLIDKLESGEVSVERAKDISERVLEIIPDKNDDSMFLDIIKKLNTIPELTGLEFGL